MADWGPGAYFRNLPAKWISENGKTAAWAAELTPAGVPAGQGNIQEVFFYRHFFGLDLPQGVDGRQNPFALGH